VAESLAAAAGLAEPAIGTVNRPSLTDGVDKVSDERALAPTGAFDGSSSYWPSSPLEPLGDGLNLTDCDLGSRRDRVHRVKAGKRVAAFDLDLDQQTLSRYIENRREWARQEDLKLELPDHYPVREQRPVSDDLSNSVDLTQFISQLKNIEDGHEARFPHDTGIIGT
jgi:ATPase MipZ